MELKNFIEDINRKGITVTFSQGKLKYIGPEEFITPEFISELKKNKGKLIKYFWPKEFDNLMPINPEGNKTPIFIVHGDNSNYIISDHLGPDQPIYGFFHPGSEGEKIPFKSVKEMARNYLNKVISINPTGPFYLIGFSFGGVLAYEMSVQLQKAGFQVPFLVLIDSVSPLAHEPFKPQKNIFQTIRIRLLRPLRIKSIDTRKLLICKSYLWIGKPIPVNRRKEYMYIRYLKLTRRYSPDKFNGDILLFRTKENPFSLKYIGWETLVNNIRLVEIEGKHLEIFSYKDRSDLLRTEIDKYLEYVKK